MPYMIALTVPQAVFLGGIGCASLGTSYVLIEMSKYVDKIGRGYIKARANTPLVHSNAAITYKITSTLGTLTKRIAAVVSNIAALLFSCLAFLLLCLGAACITYAAIGPLLV